MTDVPAGSPPREPWVPTDADFGSRLAAVRHRMRWNVKEAARECGVPAATWRLWEEGALPRNLVTIAMAIHTRTGVDLDWLVYGPSRPTRDGVTLREPTSPRVDPLAARVVAGPVQHYDKRRKPSGRVTPVRSAPSAPSVSLLVRA